MKHSFIDRFGNLDSPLHVLDARTKIVGFSALVVAALLIPAGNSGQFFAFFFLIAILAGISQIPLQYVVGRTLVILPFVLLAGLASPYRGTQRWTWLAALLLRSMLCLLILVLLANTSRFVELLRGLRKLGCPRIMVVNLGFLYRYLFVLSDEIMRMRQARDCRRVGNPGRACGNEDTRIHAGNPDGAFLRAGRSHVPGHALPRFFRRVPGGGAAEVFLA